MEKVVSFIAFVLIVVNTALATAQIPDRIIIKGKSYDLFTNPMEEYFDKNPEKRPYGTISTALWRGYVATFELENNQLVLRDIEILDSSDDSNNGKDGWKSVISEIFPDKREVKVNWFNGILVLPSGKLKEYVHMGYASTYKKYKLLEIENGELTDFKELRCKQYMKFRQKQFEAFQKTEEYKSLLSQLIKDGDTKEFIDAFLMECIVSYTGKFLDD